MSAGPRRIADTLKLRMKIGLHEFEADGPSEVVLAQVETWKQLAGLTAPPTNLSSAAPAAGDSDPALRQLFGMNADQKSITLRATLGGRRRNANAALLLLYGHGSLTAASNGAEMAPAQLGAALHASGYPLKRLDRALAPHVSAGLIHKGGTHKHTTYALTPAGHQYATELVRYLSGKR